MICILGLKADLYIEYKLDFFSISASLEIPTKEALTIKTTDWEIETLAKFEHELNA